MPSAAFDARGSQIRWTELPGAERPRVFVHGLGNNAESNLGRVARDPALGDHRSLLIDLPGHGASDRPQDFSYSLDAHADAVAAACASAGVAEVDLVGHSLGADVAIVVAHRHPGLARRLVVSEGNLDPLPPSLTGRASQAIRSQSEADFVGAGYDRLLATYPEWAETLRLCAPYAVHRTASQLTIGTVPTMREVFVAMTIPRTFIHGDRGEPLLDADGLRRAGVNVVTIPNAGHMMMFDNPAAYLAAVVAALG